MGISVHSLPLNAHKINVAYKPKYPFTHTQTGPVFIYMGVLQQRRGSCYCWLHIQ